MRPGKVVNVTDGYRTGMLHLDGPAGARAREKYLNKLMLFEEAHNFGELTVYRGYNPRNMKEFDYFTENEIDLCGN